jgi:hypothetical protein
MPENEPITRKQWSRKQIAEKIAKHEQAPAATSQRQLAEELGIPRSTLQHWLERKEAIDAAPEVIAFFESPAGVAFLHRLVLAAHFVMGLLGACGIRLVCLYLELTGLDQFVAAAYGSQQKVAVAMEKAVVSFGQAEKTRLAAGMPPKQITVCQDETFHPEICLVGIEPVSNYILLDAERYVSNRKADEWTKAMKEATAGLPVEINQSTSDQGKGIVRHVEHDLGAHHSPDVFHVDNELVKATGAVLASRQRQALHQVEDAAQRVGQFQEQIKALPTPIPPEKLALLEDKLGQAQQQAREAQHALEGIEQQQDQVRQAIRGINAAYHPYDLETGQARSAEQVAADLNQHFADIEQVATEAQLPAYSLDRIKKAKRVVVEMVATIAFFFLVVQAKMEALELTPEVEQAVYHHLIPGIYLHLVAEKAQEAEQRHTLRKHSETVLAPVLNPAGPFAQLNPDELKTLEAVATECAEVFQRSSSCVEGRNGFLALWHHSLHRLSNRKLEALTTVHNFFIKRTDGTTAAERFFDAKPKDLFEWVLEQVDLPGRPAQKRPQPERKAYLAPLVA